MRMCVKRSAISRKQYTVTLLSVQYSPSWSSSWGCHCCYLSKCVQDYNQTSLLLDNEVLGPHCVWGWEWVWEMLGLVTVLFLSSQSQYQVSFKKNEKNNKSFILKSLPSSIKCFPPIYALEIIFRHTQTYKTVVGQNHENSFGSRFPNLAG